jgi:hypothetical protein
MSKNIYALIGLFAVLLIIAFLVLQKPGEQSAKSSSLGALLNIDSASVNRIEVKTASSSLDLEKKGVDWFIVNPISYKANQAFIAQIIHQLKNLENKGTVSNKPDKFGVFQVDQSGTQIKLFENGTEKASIVLGKMAASYTESYARKLNSDDVMIVEGAFSYSFSRPVKDWRDRTILNVPRESINEISYQYGDTAFILSLKDSVWIIGRDRANRSSVDGILSALSNLQADDFIDSTFSPKISTSIRLANEQIRFSFDRKPGKYYVQTSASPQWFVLDQWRANQILKRKKELIQPDAK